MIRRLTAAVTWLPARGDETVFYFGRELDFVDPGAGGGFVDFEPAARDIFDAPAVVIVFKLVDPAGGERGLAMGRSVSEGADGLVARLAFRQCAQPLRSLLRIGMRPLRNDRAIGVVAQLAFGKAHGPGGGAGRVVVGPIRQHFHGGALLRRAG